VPAIDLQRAIGHIEILTAHPRGAGDRHRGPRSAREKSCLESIVLTRKERGHGDGAREELLSKVLRRVKMTVTPTTVSKKRAISGRKGGYRRWLSPRGKESEWLILSANWPPGRIGICVVEHQRWDLLTLMARAVAAKEDLKLFDGVKVCR
jgi:hypothetical protein